MALFDGCKRPWNYALMSKKERARVDSEYYACVQGHRDAKNERVGIKQDGRTERNADDNERAMYVAEVTGTRPGEAWIPVVQQGVDTGLDLLAAYLTGGVPGMPGEAASGSGTGGGAPPAPGVSFADDPIQWARENPVPTAIGLGGALYLASKYIK